MYSPNLSTSHHRVFGLGDPFQYSHFQQPQLSPLLQSTSMYPSSSPPSTSAHNQYSHSIASSSPPGSDSELAASTATTNNGVNTSKHNANANNNHAHTYSPGSSTSLPSPSISSRNNRILSNCSHSSSGSPDRIAVSLDAPTQPRRYLTASSTSRKDIPQYFAKRRAPYQISDGEEDELTEEPPAANATDQEKIDYKRRQNTLAARRSRKRKMLHQQYLQDSVDQLSKEKEIWKTRAETLRSLLISNGIPCPEW